MNVKYLGYLDALSGMGDAARNFVQALHSCGVPVTTQFMPNLTTNKDLGPAHRTCQLLNGKDIDYKIKIIHLTPDIVTTHLEPMKYHIFHLFWETDKLPDWWVWALNLVDEIWTGSEWSKKVFIDSGVKRPIFVFPQPCEVEKHAPEPFHIDREFQFVFYSIFQWIERKNPKSLLTAYWKEFQGNDDVCLMLKVYKTNFSAIETAAIMREIEAWKTSVNQDHYPAVGIFPHVLSRKEVSRFHQTGSCFVLPHRGEGWGRPIQEAMLHNKPVISTDLGGVHEFVPEKLWYPLKYEMIPLFNMDWCPWYNQDQQWAQVDERDLREKMRLVYEHRDVPISAQDYARNAFSYLAVGSLLKKRIQEIYQKLDKRVYG